MNRITFSLFSDSSFVTHDRTQVDNHRILRYIHNIMLISQLIKGSKEKFFNNIMWNIFICVNYVLHIRYGNFVHCSYPIESIKICVWSQTEELGPR